MNEMNPLIVQLDIGGAWRTEIFIGLFVCLLYLILMYYKKVGLIATALWLYVLTAALWLFEFPSIPFGLYNPAFQTTASQTFAEALIIPMVFISMKETHLKWVKLFFNVMVALNGLHLWYFGFGMMLSPSFDTALMALFLPFANIWVAIFTVITVVAHHGSTALMILLAQLFGYVILRKRMIPGLFIAIPAAVSLAYLHQNAIWFDSGERLVAWQRYMSLWWHDDWKNKIFGMGPGSFIWLSMMIDKYKEPIFMQMHSDWLQVTFELGLAGLALVIAFFAQALRLSYRNSQLFCAVFGAAAFGLTYHPVRFMPSMLMLAFIFRQIFSGNKKGPEQKP